MYTYLFPTFIQSSLFVSFSHSLEVRPVVICFVGDSKTGNLISYALSYGVAPPDLYERALMKVRERARSTPITSPYGFFSMIVPKEKKLLVMNADTPACSMDWRKRQRLSLINVEDFHDELLRALYDWSPQVQMRVDNPFVLDFHVFNQIMKELGERMSTTNPSG